MWKGKGGKKRYAQIDKGVWLKIVWNEMEWMDGWMDGCATHTFLLSHNVFFVLLILQKGRKDGARE